MIVERPGDGEYAPFYAGYISLVPEADVLDVLQRQIDDIDSHVRRIPSEMETYAYAPGKWSIREVYGHLSDAERVFGYRAVCFSRGEQASLPGFDEKAYVALSGFAQTRLGELVTELRLLREANLAALRRFDAEAWARTGTANNNRVSVRALAFIMAGHVRHHLKVLNERYRQA